MGFYNINEDKVITEVNAIFDCMEQAGNPQNICTCSQCRTDTMCYVLNRMEPQYVVSNRGVARAERETIKYQQKGADMVSLIYEGIKQVQHHLRPNHKEVGDRSWEVHKPVFRVPLIIGRIFNGLNFAPLEVAQIELRSEQTLVSMINGNWQNPYQLVSYVAGIFTFLPYPIPATSEGIRKNFEFTLYITAPSLEERYHIFEVPILSETASSVSFSMERIFRLPDLYMFPPGAEEPLDDPVGLGSMLVS
ncbi:MAG: late competence development ComFB family protein [Treponema sp.]|nr:late competence development ComFB family protein [Treponema sp.]